MNSTPAASSARYENARRANGIGLKRYFRRERRGLRNRTPSPVSFSSMNSIPADFEGMPYRRFVGERNWNFTINDFDPTDRCDSHLGCGGKVEGCPSQHGASRTHLSACNFSCHRLLIFMIQYDVIYIIRIVIERPCSLLLAAQKQRES